MKRPPKGPRKGGRPAAKPGAKREEIIKVRMSTEECARLDERRAQTGKGRSTFMREASFKLRIVAPPSVANRKAYIALSKTMNNLNQLTKAVNSGLRQVDMEMIGELKEHLYELRRELVRKPR